MRMRYDADIIYAGIDRVYVTFLSIYQEFKSGCFACSIKSKAPIVPVVIYDSWRSMDTNTFDSYVSIPMTSIPVPGYISVEVAYLMRDVSGNILQSKDGIEINYIPLKNMLIKYQGETELINDYFNLMGSLRDDFIARYPYMDIANTYLQPVSIFRVNGRLVYMFEIFVQDMEIDKFLEQDKENKVVARLDLPSTIQSMLDTLKFKFIGEE